MTPHDKAFSITLAAAIILGCCMAFIGPVRAIGLVQVVLCSLRLGMKLQKALDSPPPPKSRL
jgi:hypothetical protein